MTVLVSALAVAALALLVERVVEVQLGLPGVIGLMLLRTGVSKRSAAVAGVGATVLIMLTFRL
jgi:hypothetical protein